MTYLTEHKELERIYNCGKIKHAAVKYAINEINKDNRYVIDFDDKIEACVCTTTGGKVKTTKGDVTIKEFTIHGELSDNANIEKILEEGLILKTIMFQDIRKYLGDNKCIIRVLPEWYIADQTYTKIGVRCRVGVLPYDWDSKKDKILEGENVKEL